MQPYQEEYIANMKEIAGLTARKKAGSLTFDAFETELLQSREQLEQKINYNMKLLREQLFPQLDHLLEAAPELLQELQEFAGNLLNGQSASDSGLFCLIHQALLNLARLRKDQYGIIRELYWLGIGRHNQCNKVMGLEFSLIENYISSMRLCFMEAAAYLKYYNEIEDTETRGYILRSRANIALGQFKNPSEKIHLVKQTLQILQDKDYQDKTPELPWDRYIYMTHQQMAASISYSKTAPMTPEDIADVMESVYLVYQRRLIEASQKNEILPVRPSFNYYAIEYYCGLSNLQELLSRIEHLMDSASLSDFSADNMYALISLPAFYCQFLQQYPERIPERKEYIASLYQKILDYMDAFPETSENDTLFLYLRQLAHTFVETENSISYGDFLKKLMVRFTPETYVHSYMVGNAAALFSQIIISEDPAYFDDMEHIKTIQNPEEKRRRITDDAMHCGLYHDVGKLSFIDLYAQTARQWLEEEYELAHLHTIAGESFLTPRPSTQSYANAALGHHSWYDGSHGYPDTYKRLEHSDRQLVDIIGLVDWIENVTGIRHLYTGVKKTFEEAIEEAITLEGRRFSPLLTARLRDKEVTEHIRQALADGRRDAYRQLYLEEKHSTHTEHS